MENQFNKLRELRSEIESDVYLIVGNRMKDYAEPHQFMKELEEISFAVGRYFVEWVIRSKGVIRNKHNNEVPQAKEETT